MRRCLAALWFLFWATTAQAAGFVGAYVWGGVITQSGGLQQFYDSVNAVLVAGFDTIRIDPGPSGMPGTALSIACSGNSNLACYLQQELASSVWDNPGLKRVMLTAIDQTCSASGNNNCMNPSFLAANQAAIQAEYTAMFQVLKTRFGSRNIQFVLANWEGDNFIYGGSAYDFGRNTGGTFVSTTQASWQPAGQTNVQRVQAFLQWIGYRDSAVAAFVSANPGFNLIQAPEFSNYNLFAPGCGGGCNASTDTVLDQIAAAGGRAYCSYSSYDTQGPPGGSYLAAVKAILATCQNLIIGEAGYDLLGGAANVANDVALFKAMDQLRNVQGVMGVIPWNAISPASGAQKFGMFDPTGARQVINLLGPLLPTPQVPAKHR